MKSRSLFSSALFLVAIFLCTALPHSAEAANACTSAGTGNWSAPATWASCGGTTPQTLDTATILTGNTVTLDTNATTTGVTINSGGTLTDDGTGKTLVSSGGWTNNGTFTAVSDTVHLTLAQTITGNTTFNNLILNSGITSTVSYTMTGTSTITGAFTLANSSTGGVKVLGGAFIAQGDITVDGAHASGSTAVLTISGTGMQTIFAPGTTRTLGAFLPVIINKPSGTLIFPAMLRTANNWTYIAGTLNTSTNNSTVVFSAALNITGTETLNNIIFDSNSTSNITIFIITGTTLTASGSLIVQDSLAGVIKITNGTLQPLGDMTVDESNTASGIGNVYFAGSNNQALTLLNGSTTGGGVFASTTINKSGGTLTVSGILRMGVAPLLSVGNVDWTTNNATLAINASTLLTPGTSTYNNIYIDTAGSLTLGAPLSIAGNWTDNNILTNSAPLVTFTGTGASTLSISNTTASQAFQNVTIAKTGGGSVQITGGALKATAAVTISSGILDLNGFPIASTTSIVNNGTLRLTGTESLSSTPTNNSGSVVEYYATTTATTAIKPWTYQSLKFSGTGGTFTDSTTRTLPGTLTISGSTYAPSATLTVTATTTINGGTLSATSATLNLSSDLVLSSGTLVAPSGTLTVGGNWTNSGGTFLNSSGSVVLNGTSQSILGTNTFYNLTKNVSSAAILTLGHTGTATIQHSVNLQGTLGNILSLRSDLSGTQSTISLPATTTLFYLNVQDSNNTGTAPSVGSTVVNGGNDTGWSFSGTDTTPPTVVVTSPISAAILHGTAITLTASSTDNVGVVGVQFKVDTNTNLGAEVTSTSSPSIYSLTLDSTTLSEGAHTIIAVSRDAAGNYATSTAISVTVQNDSITQYGITWTFDHAYQWGQFANGDYWVLGPVTVTSISPNSTNDAGTAGTGRNGWEVNPTSHVNQPYDDRAYNYLASLQPSLPLTVQATSSIIKTISYAGTPAGANSPDLQTAAVLTVVATVPPGNGSLVFRPAYFGSATTSKPYYYVSSMDLNQLPSLTPPACTTSPTNSCPPSIATVASNYQHVQLDHETGFTGRNIHPIDNMPDYGGNIADENAEAVLRLMLNDVSTANKQQAAINYIQDGLDTYQDLITGENWAANGGHEPGRKILLIFTGVVMHSTAITTAVSTAPNNTFSEDGDALYSQKANGGNGIVLWAEPGTTPESGYWSELENPGTGSKVAPDPYQYIDGGDVPGTNYQALNFGPNYASSIAARLIPGGATIWNDPNFFNYVDRLINVGTWTQPDPCAPYDGNSADYGVTFGPDGHGSCIKDTNPSDGIGRFPTLQGNWKNNPASGLYASYFADNMLATYDSTVNVSPTLIMTVATSSPTSTSGLVTWNDDKLASTQIAYGLTSSYGATTTLDSTATTTRSVTLSGLASNTTYHFQIRATDAVNGLLATSSDQTFTTGASIDTTPPIVSVTVPTGGATVSGTSVTLTASSTDDVAVGGVTFYINGTKIGNEVTSGSTTFSTTWDSTATSSGSYSVIAVSRDTSNNYATSSPVTFTVSNAGPAISNISAGTPSQTAATITWTTGTAGNSRIDYGTTSAYGTATTTAALVTSHSMTLTGLTASTLYHYRVQSTDSVGNTATSSDQTFTTVTPADTTPPTVTLTSPANASTVSGASVSLSATATDNVAVAAVQFKLDGITNIGAPQTVSSPYSVTWNSTGTSDGTHTISAVAVDTAGNTATSSVSVTVDNTAPVVSSISAGSPAQTTATITWTTNENSTSVVNFGTTTGYGTSSSSPALVTSHSIIITGLTANTTYHYQISSVDGSGNATTTSDHTFITASVPDTIAPVVALTSPTNGATVTGVSVALSANASDNVAVAGVQFKIDTTPLGAELTSGPYALTWDSTTAIDGSHTVSAVARDAAGNYATSSVTVIVDNTAPIRSAGSPSSTLALNTTSTTISLTTNENATCKYSTTAGTAYTSMTSTFGTTGGTSHSSSITGLTNGGSYVYYVRCQDTIGNFNKSDYAISFSVANDSTSPVVSLTAPANNATVSGHTLSITATATDDVSVAGVQFQVDGANYGSVQVSGPYATTLDTTTLIDGTHALSAVAHDGSGNFSTSTIVSIKVDNTPPVVSALTASSLTQTGATITWTTNESATSQVQYGLTTSYGSTTTLDPTLVKQHSVAVSSLTPNTTYHYEVITADGQGNTTTSGDQTFTTTATADVTPPVISSISANGSAQTSATVTWSTDEGATSQVNYGTSSSYGSATALDSTLVTSHSETVPNLTAGTTYHYAVVSTDASGNTATSGDQTFTTAAATVTPPVNTPPSNLSGVHGESAAPTRSNPVTTTTTSSPTGTVTTTTTGTAVFTRSLTIGSTGADVLALQKFLNANGYVIATTGAGSPGNETTYFGAATQAALAKYQAAHGIVPAAGYFGPVTIGVLSAGTTVTTVTPSAPVATVVTSTPASTSFTKDLQLGMTDPQVLLLQKYLNSHGFIIATSGAGSPGNETTYFGNATQAAVIAFQKASGITPTTGYFGSISRAYIASH